MKEKIINFLNEYIKKRKSAKCYETLIRVGYNGEYRINKMITARILKPSELQIEEEIDDANNIHKFILTLLDNKEISLLLEEKKLEFNYIRNIKFEKLLDCKSIYTICAEIGMLGQKKLGAAYLIVGGFTIAEAFLTIITIGFFLKVSII